MKHNMASIFASFWSYKHHYVENEVRAIWTFVIHNQRHSLQLFVVEIDTCLVWELLCCHLMPILLRTRPLWRAPDGDTSGDWFQLFECLPLVWISVFIVCMWFCHCFLGKLLWKDPDLMSVFSYKFCIKYSHQVDKPLNSTFDRGGIL